jgi:hypothetical protein
MLVCMTVLGTVGLPGAAFSQDPGVHFDPGSPAGKEYAIPLAEGRSEGAGTRNQRAAADTPFGAGITPPGAGRGTDGGGGTGGNATGGGGDAGPTDSGAAHGEEQGGPSGRAKNSPSGARGAQRGADRAVQGGADGRGGNRPVIDERAVSDAEAPVDTTGRTIGIALGVLLVGILLALLLWRRREQPAA